jgi:cyanophycin synthetase
MQILQILTMRGPNVWSDKYFNLTVAKVDIGKFELTPTDTIEGFADNLLGMIPSLGGRPGSNSDNGEHFIDQIRRGISVSTVIEQVAVEIQALAGMTVPYSDTRRTSVSGVYTIMYAHCEEEAGRYAIRAAVAIVEAAACNKPCNVDIDIAALCHLYENGRFGVSTEAIVAEARKRDIPVIRLNSRSLIQLGYGSRQKRMEATTSSYTSNIAVEIAGNKEDTKALLRSYQVPVPHGEVVTSELELFEAIRSIGFPVVIKPLDGNHGRGTTVDVRTPDDAIEALRFALSESREKRSIVEKFIRGDDYRILLVNYKFVAAARRIPASVTGDGSSTISQLIERVNADPHRKEGHAGALTRIGIDEITIKLLEEQGLTPESVLPAGQKFILKMTANISTGGTSVDVTDTTHPANIALAERIARIIGLDICGIDIISPDLGQPLLDTGGVIIEVNAGPGLRMHLQPGEGQPRNVVAPILDMLFPVETSARIPIIAITGTNGKTTTTRLLAHIMQTAGRKTGFTTTDGIYMSQYCVEKGDCTGSISAGHVLRDPTVEVAVLECARGGILRSGLGFDKCDVGIVTNVAADHLGLHGIETVEEMAEVKSVVPRAVMPEGLAILNADDDLVYEMRNRVKSKVGLFSLDAKNPRVLAHCADGGTAAVVEDGMMTIIAGTLKIPIEVVKDIPLSFGGAAGFMVQNVLAAVLAAYQQLCSVDIIRRALATFLPSEEQTPGRMNIIHFSDFDVMVDYAHNPAGFRALAQFLAKVEATHKVGIITAVGDRRDEDIRELGRLAAGMFDEIIIRLDKDLRGRPGDDIVRLLMEGITSEVPHRSIAVIADTTRAVCNAITNARSGSFIMVCCDNVEETLAIVRGCKEKEGAMRRTVPDSRPLAPLEV